MVPSAPGSCAASGRSGPKIVEPVVLWSASPRSFRFLRLLGGGSSYLHSVLDAAPIVPPERDAAIGEFADLSHDLPGAIIGGRRPLLPGSPLAPAAALVGTLRAKTRP